MSGSPPPLTEREREVLDLLCLGWQGKQIAVALGISRRTVEHHVERMRVRLGLSTHELIALALRLGLVRESRRDAPQAHPPQAGREPGERLG